MASRGLLGRVVVSLIVIAGWTAWAGAQPYAGYGPTTLGYNDYGDTYSLGPWYPVPPPSRYIYPSYSYNPNPYASFPGAFSYEVPPFAYAPNSYNYDLRAYGYMPGFYPPPAYPFGYYYPYFYPSYYPYFYPYHLIRQYRLMGYRPMTRQEYLIRGLHGPTRVRDVVPDVPELGGRTPRERR